jgi:hypothetical protein
MTYNQRVFLPATFAASATVALHSPPPLLIRRIFFLNFGQNFFPKQI